MKRLIVVITSLLTPLCINATSTAQDRLTKQAIEKIDSVETRAKALKPGDVAGAKRLLQDLGWAARRLKAAYDKTDKHYADAVKRHGTLRKQLLAIANGPAAKPDAAYDVAALQQLNKEIGNGFRNLRLLNKTFMGDEFRVRSIERN